ncbi:flavodoxin [Clostridium saccharoperbutylacetonicum]|uniref:flavodoxin n=1 Tax=Clostridium saccharoperbutylacetonicum TaxID=36745 RepID=UPI0039EB3652
MINLCFINGSPKKEKSNSSYLIKELSNLLNSTTQTKEYFINNIMKDDSLIEEIISCDKIVFVSPLYADCFPSAMLDFMSKFEDILNKKNTPKIDMYCIVNCGFLEGTQNRIAIDIMENYCKILGFNWRFGIGIGGGEFMGSSKDMPINSRLKKPVYNAFLTMKEDIENISKSHIDNLLISPKIPKFLFKFAANISWKSQAKSNNLNPKELYKQIY